jgi:hypothetical protein
MLDLLILALRRHQFIQQQSATVDGGDPVVIDPRTNSRDEDASTHLENVHGGSTPCCRLPFARGAAARWSFSGNRRLLSRVRCYRGSATCRRAGYGRNFSARGPLCCGARYLFSRLWAGYSLSVWPTRSPIPRKKICAQTRNGCRSPAPGPLRSAPFRSTSAGTTRPAPRTSRAREVQRALVTPKVAILAASPR